MRTVSFQSVYEAILQRLGLDPLADAITHDTARAICEHMTERAQTAWQMWDWPVLTRTEERAFRAPWYSSVAYHRNLTIGKPDEVYYINTEKYYKVNQAAISDPPIGTPPSNAAFWTEFQDVTTFVDRDQLGKLPLGQVVGVYKSDPSINGAAPHDICLKFRPSEAGTYLSYAPLPTVFICYIVQPPTYSFVPWIQFGKQYLPGHRVFYHPTGQCYICVKASGPGTAQPPTNTEFWAVEPVPDVFASYIKAGAACDCLKESTPPEDQIRLARAGAWEKEAQSAIESEIDQLLAQGQKHYYIKPYWSDGWCLSEPWLGSIAISLSGSIYSSPPHEEPVLPPSPGIIYHPEIDVVLSSGSGTSLQELSSKELSLDTIIQFTVGNTANAYRVDPGPKNPSDPKQVTPLDYDSVANDKHYQKIE
jgi:hypothetical protein